MGFENPRDKFNVGRMKDELASVLQSSLQTLVEGAAADLAGYAQEIANDAASAMMQPDPAKRDQLLKELQGQVTALGEVHRIRANNESWRVANLVISTAIKAAVGAMISVI